MAARAAGAGVGDPINYGPAAPAAVLTAADLEVNVLEFRGRQFQFDRIADVGGTSFAVFSRTETESESKFRPRLVRLFVVVPLEWARLDPATDDLRISRDALGLPMAPDTPVVEVAAERPEFRDGGVDWRRVAAPGESQVYLPAELREQILAPGALAALGIG